MSATYATSAANPERAGRCAWRFHFEDVDLRCSNRPIPGGTECADHLIERVHRRYPTGEAT